MSERTIFHLIQPCKNRGISFANNGDGTVTIEGRSFFSSSDAEEFIASFPRKDI